MPEDVAVPEVQDQTPIEDTSLTDGGQGVTAEPFLSYTHDDGEALSWSSPEEVQKYIREGTLRHADYTRKTQEIAEQRKALDAERQKFDGEYQNFLGLKTRVDKYDQFLRQNPHVEQELKKVMRGPRPSPEVEELRQKMQSLEAERETERASKKRSEAIEKAHELMMRDYTDYDRAVIEKGMKDLDEAAPGDDHRLLFELIYYATKGRETPAQVEQRLAKNLERKQQAHSPMGASSKGTTGKAVHKNFDEARNAALSN